MSSSSRLPITGGSGHAPHGATEQPSASNSFGTSWPLEYVQPTPRRSRRPGPSAPRRRAHVPSYRGAAWSDPSHGATPGPAARADPARAGETVGKPAKVSPVIPSAPGGSVRRVVLIMCGEGSIMPRAALELRRQILEAIEEEDAAS